MIAEKIKPFNDKAIESITNTGFLTAWEGSVRSSKTLTSLIPWIDYIIRSPEKVFLMSGNTLGSLSRNCLEGDFGLYSLTMNQARKRRDDSGWYLDFVGKRIYLTGAGNQASYKSITGLTIGGWYADEVNLHDPQAVVEFFNRSIASGDRRNFWTLNPSPPNHWVYTDYLDKYLEDKVPGFRLFHFTLDDNPGITEERKAELHKQYTGVFYKRYILGLRVRAEGSCYPSFNDSCILDDFDYKRIMNANIGIDPGGKGEETKGKGSATAASALGFFINDAGKLSVILFEEMHDTVNRSTEYIIDKLKNFIIEVKRLAPCGDCYADSAEQLIKRSIQNFGLVNSHDSLKKPIVDRIRFFDWLMATGRFFILRKCRDTIQAIESAVWTSKGDKEDRLDDGTSNIDNLDSMEYAAEPRMRDFR